MVLLKVCRRIYQCKIQVKFDISNHPQNFGQVMALFRQFLLVCRYLFPINNFCRDALIFLKVCRKIYYCKLQVKFDIGNHPQNLGQVMALFRLSPLGIGAIIRTNVLFRFHIKWFAFLAGDTSDSRNSSCLELPTPRRIANQGLRAPSTLDIATQIQIKAIQKQ